MSSYPRPYSPLVPPSFLPLSPCAVATAPPSRWVARPSGGWRATRRRLGRTSCPWRGDRVCGCGCGWGGGGDVESWEWDAARELPPSSLSRAQWRMACGVAQRPRLSVSPPLHPLPPGPAVSMASRPRPRAPETLPGPGEHQPSQEGMASSGPAFTLGQRCAGAGLGCVGSSSTEGEGARALLPVRAGHQGLRWEACPSRPAPQHRAASSSRGRRARGLRAA
jgi:hypothetical protein